MRTRTEPAAAVSIAGPEAAARAAWRRRVARIGSLIQLAFAILWIIRGTLATGWPGRLPLALALAAGAAGLAVWGTLATAAILTASAITGFRALATGALGSPPLGIEQCPQVRFGFRQP